MLDSGGESAKLNKEYSRVVLEFSSVIPKQQVLITQQFQYNIHVTAFF